jgi:hypothetical protein
MGFRVSQKKRAARMRPEFREETPHKAGVGYGGEGAISILTISQLRKNVKRETAFFYVRCGNLFFQLMNFILHCTPIGDRQFLPALSSHRRFRHARFARNRNDD